MSLWRQLTRGLRVLANGAPPTEDVADEVQHYLEQATAALEARGLSPDEARRAARLELGSVTVRPRTGARVRLGEPRQHAAGRPALCRAAAASKPGLHGGQPSSRWRWASVRRTAIFSAVNPILFEPLPYPHAGQIAMILENRPRARVGHVRHVSRARGAQPLVRGDRGDEAVAADHDRVRRAGATRRAARQRRLLPGAGRAAGRWDATSSRPTIGSRGRTS